MWLCEDKLKEKTDHFRLPSASQKRTCLSSLFSTVEPQFNEIAGDRPNLFVKSGVRYIENLDITNLSGNDQNVRYIEVIVNDRFVTQVTSVTQFNAIFVTQKCRVLRCNSLSMVAFSSNYFHF